MDCSSEISGHVIDTGDALPRQLVVRTSSDVEVTVVVSTTQERGRTNGWISLGEMTVPPNCEVAASFASPLRHVRLALSGAASSELLVRDHGLHRSSWACSLASREQ